MAEKVFVDTGGWAALLGANDENHAGAVSVFNRLKAARAVLFTSDYVFDETVTLTMARGNHAHSVVAGRAILESSVVKMIPIAPDYLESSWALYQKLADKRFSFTDATSLTVMRSLGISKIFGYDREFVKAGVQLIQ